MGEGEGYGLVVVLIGSWSITLTKADKKVNKAIASDDYDKIQKAIVYAGDDLSDAVDSCFAGYG